jgi:threonine dehydratase
VGVGALNAPATALSFAAAPLAALLQEKAHQAGRRVGVILSGGNIDRGRFLDVMSHRIPLAPGADAAGLVRV